jgi:CubicO group peptidase (beta-lactamase class C family)
MIWSTQGLSLLLFVLYKTYEAHMKINLIIACIFCFLLHDVLLAQNNAALEKNIEDLLGQQKLAGAVWTTVQNDSIHTYSAGLKNMKTGEKLLQTDKVQVGSITKTVLALGVLRLATEGKIQLDQPIKTILPGLPVSNRWETTNPVTIGHLLDHTSGLSDLRLWHFFSTTATPHTPLADFYIRNPDVLKVYEKPGNVFSYSNMGYTILGMIIESITKQPYEKYLDEQLLQPIGMYNSTFRFLSQQEGEYKAADLAMGHFDNGKIAPALPIYVRPAGQFTTTAADMGILLQFLLHKGRTGQGYFIDSSYFDSYGKPEYTIAYKNGLHNGYASGSFLRDRHGVVGLAHSGNIIGYRAMFYIFPAEKKGFFISHNMDSETADYEVFNKALIDYLGIPKRITPVDKVQTTEGLAKWEGYYIPVIIKVEPLGLFDMVSGFTTIKVGNNDLSFIPFQKKVVELDYVGNRLFQSKEKVNPSVFLYENEQQLYLTTGISTLQKISGWTIFLLAASCVLGMSGILLVFVSGVYQLVKYKSRFFAKPLAWSFSGIVLLMISIILIALQGIIHIGNKNAGSLLLYGSTVLLPLLSLVSLSLYSKRGKAAWRTIGWWSVVLIIQFSLVLYFYGLIPFATWK